MVTVAEIAAKAFDGVAGKIAGVIHPATMNWTEKGAYDPDTGSYTTTAKSDTGRAVEDSEKPVADVFEGYVAGPADVLVLMEGFTTVPKENHTITYAGRTRTILRAQDIVAAGAIYYVVAR
ncbi:hypothetical protein [Oceaniglobus ichthyenteri]|uniref:hypothetical protein n=1 Tax=Oceaniglobus ichthyenteri TaxID=2136177 RepID=UPI000D39220B|nr:hypothetical protein [Oceaniglobus ichthyenteri]